MSFRGKLTLFFVGIVVVPMVAVAIVVFRLVDTSETGQADARLAQGQIAAIGLLREHAADAERFADRLGHDRVLTRALLHGRQKVARRRARTLAAGAHAQRMRILLRGRPVVDLGRGRRAIGSTRRALVDTRRRRFATIDVSLLAPGAYVREVWRVTGLAAVVRQNTRTLGSSLDAMMPGKLVAGTATTVDAAQSGPTGPAGEPSTASPTSPARLPDSGTVSITGRRYRTASFSTPGFDGHALRVVMLADDAPTGAATTNGRRVVALVLLALLLVACAFAVSISRTLHGQVGRFLEAARRLGSGDFSREVPVEGRDEFAQLGGEFNKMSGQLEQRLEELRRERGRLRDAIRRTGETLASNLDRDAVLHVSVPTAIDAVRADCGRISVADEPGGAPVPWDERDAGDRAPTSQIAEPCRSALRAAEAAALASGELQHAQVGGIAALAYPLRDPGAAPETVLAILAVARRGDAFDEDDTALFRSIAVQVTASLENVELHELVRRQAITDELTGLSNHRRFQEVLTQEVERARRFEQPLALVMLDIDRFKDVNDTYGHQQGDAVLRAVADVLRDCTREIDEPARYGGEEMAVALARADLDGAEQLAERTRRAIEQLEIPRLDGGGTLRVTASFGVAALPENATAKVDLIAAADAALYDAKRGGRNRTCTPGHDPADAARAE